MIITVHKVCRHPRFQVVFHPSDYDDGVVATVVCTFCGAEADLQPLEGKPAPNPNCQVGEVVGYWCLPDNPFEPQELWHA